MSMHAYMAYAGEAAEGAVLVFARTVKEAKPIGHHAVCGFGHCDWIDLRVRRMRHEEAYLLSLADPDKLAAGTPHYNDNPPTCESCELWGSPLIPDRHCCTFCDIEESQ